VLATARNVGMVVGVGVSGAVLTTWMAHASRPAVGLVHGTQAALLLAAGLAVTGAITSALR
jgi:hypothetical protein